MPTNPEVDKWYGSKTDFNRLEYDKWFNESYKRLLKEVEGSNDMKDQSDDELGFGDSVMEKLEMDYSKPYNPIKPPHYIDDNDVYQFCLDNDLGGLEMNIVKYVSRWKEKDGIQDLLKAKETLERLINYYE